MTMKVLTMAMLVRMSCIGNKPAAQADVGPLQQAHVRLKRQHQKRRNHQGFSSL